MIAILSISDAFLKNAQAVPLKMAVWCDGESMSYVELQRNMYKLCHLLDVHGVKYGDHVGILLHNEITFVTFILAAAHMGFALVPLRPTMPVRAVKSAFKSSDVKHIIANGAVFEDISKEGMPFADGLWLSVDERVKNAEYMPELLECISDTPFEANAITGDEALILTLTSGSTGKPKPIVLTQSNKYNRAMAAAELYSVTSKDVVLAATPLYHSLAERLVILPLLLGGTSILLSKFSPGLWFSSVKEHAVTFTIAVSSQLAQIAEALTSPFLPEITSLRCIVSSSALLEMHVKTELLEKLKCDFHECYGTSEIAIASSIDFNDAKKKLKSVGKAAPGVDIKIIKDTGEDATTGEKGEIICRTPMLFGGYYKLPEMTQASIKDGYFCTGDIGTLDDDGYLYFLDRKKDVIITGAVNVYPSDVESVILELPSVKECAAFPYPDDRFGEVVAVAIVPEDKESFQQRAVKFHCLKQLADFQQPRHYFIVDSLPKNNMGKLVKHELAEKLAKN